MKKKIIIIICLAVLCCGFVGYNVCFGDENGFTEVVLSDEQIDSLMEQYVSDEELEYADYLPSCWIASCKVFGVQRKENRGYVYAYVLDEEFVDFKGKAYGQSGGYMPVKLEIEFDGECVKYISAEYPEDGSAYEESMRSLFPLKYYLLCRMYNPHDANGSPKLEKEQEEKVRELWGVEVEQDDLLMIEEGGTYELIETTNDEFNGFEMRTKESGALEKIK